MKIAKKIKIRSNSTRYEFFGMGKILLICPTTLEWDDGKGYAEG